MTTGAAVTERVIDRGECRPCRTLRVYGRFADSVPAGFRHCTGCHETLRANHTLCHCADCHRTFGSLEAFDTHRGDSRAAKGTPAARCHDPAKLAEEHRNPISEGPSAPFVHLESGVWVLDRPWGGSKPVEVEGVPV